MFLNETVVPTEFNGDIEQIPLIEIINNISFSCILFTENNINSGVLFFKKGKLIDAELNKIYHITKAKEILSQAKGTFFYQKWELGREFELKVNQLRSVLHYIEIAYLNAEIKLIFENVSAKILCSEGIIVGIEPKPNDVNLFIKDIIQKDKGRIIIKCTSGQTGDLKEYFSEILTNSNTEIVEQSKFEKIPNTNSEKKSTKTKPVHKEQINIQIIEQSFNHLKNDIGDVFIAGSLYTTKLGKPIYNYKSETNQTVLFSKLHKLINNLLSEGSFGKINDFYLLDLEENYLIFILTFKDHHISLVFDKSKVKIGYLFSIIKPLLIHDYENAINS